MIFSILFYCSSVPIYNGVLVLGYSTIYTNLPVISLIFDRDTNIKNVLDFPNLYSSLQKGRLLSIKNFLLWFQKSLFQAAIIMIGAVLLFDNVFLYIVTITFTSLIIAELLNVYTEVIILIMY
jgi:phospholipid-translocating ATPase